MNKEEKLKRIEDLKLKIEDLKREADYYNALQLALKLVLNGSYGAFATPYFVLYNNYVAGTITATGRDLIQTMDKVNESYWYEQWDSDYELHNKLGVLNVKKILRDINPVSIYCDTDSLFVSFKPAMDHCDWKNNIFNKDFIESVDKSFVVINYNPMIDFNNKNCISHFTEKISKDNKDELEKIFNMNSDLYLIDGFYSKDRILKEFIKKYNIESKIKWNWDKELDFVLGIDEFRFGGYFKDKLDEYAASFGVENKEDFELEKISESIINIAKKKYIQHLLYEDGIQFDRFKYLFPKGVELIRSSTPLFAREKIVNIVRYLFEHPDNFNIKELLKLVKNLRKEFELADIDDIAMQSSCSNYDDKVIQDKSLPLKFVSGAHFAVKAAGHYNYLLSTDKEYVNKYEYIKSGTKIKYFYCKDTAVNDIFAYIRGTYPHEFAPQVDYDKQFSKSILSPINSIIAPLGLPEITDRLSVIVDIFGQF